MATVRKRGNSYQIRSSRKYDVYGRHKEESMSWTPPEGMTHRQIEKELMRLQVLMDSRATVSGNIKFQNFAEQWFEERVNGKLKEATRTKYRQLSVRVYDLLGHYRVDQITRRDVQRFVAMLEKPDVKKMNRGRTGGGALSEKSVRHHLSMVSAIMEYAVWLEMIPANPCKGVIVAQRPPEPHQSYSLEEARDILNTMGEDAPTVRYAYFQLLAYSGMRKGEALGLRWKDIDLTSGVVTIAQSMGYTKDKGVYTDTPKTNTSARSIRLPMIVMETLQTLREQQRFDRAKMWNMWQNDVAQLVFVGQEGEPLANNSMYAWFKRYCAAHDMPCYGLHAFRHFAASQLIHAGIDVRTVAAYLGHAKPTTTLNIYADEINDAKAKAADVLAADLMG